jgi:hypothetical protein
MREKSLIKLTLVKNWVNQLVKKKGLLIRKFLVRWGV